MKTAIKETLLGMAFFLSAVVIRDMGTWNLGWIFFCLLVIAIVTSPITCPIAWLVWFGQPGPRSLELRHARVVQRAKERTKVRPLTLADLRSERKRRPILPGGDGRGMET